ncbi:HNH endonuclease [Streptomyces sp. NPDC096354]|uniref:HNH endonuclease n=1 Tax=Streptomyces sp. NPDC096354 TaxID=3366088 RepID=UPI003803390E
MRKGEITREAVLKALGEYDQLGPDAFRDAYGYGKALAYVLVHEGREYDSEAIVGVAYKHDQGRLLESDELSGGRGHAVAELKRLGFHVKVVRNPDWARDELILACALVVENGWRGLDANDPRVVELSQLLQMLPIHDGASRNETFRNPNGVARKTFDISTRHPDYRKKPTNGGALDLTVLRDFLDRPTEMMEAVRLIRVGIASGELQDLSPIDDDELDDYSAPEGRLLLRQHLRRERNRSLRKRKIESVLRARGRLACEACEFDFEQQYGDRGAGYIECHHVVPLHEAGEGRTKLADLALICANCHRMIHRRAPWPTPPELRALIETQTSASTNGAVPTQRNGQTLTSA